MRSNLVALELGGRYESAETGNRVGAWDCSNRDGPMMIKLHKDAPASAACGRSGLALMAECPDGHRRSIPWLDLRTHNDDETPLYGRPYKCFVCGRSEVTLFAIETQAELDAVRSTFLRRETVDRGIGMRTSEPYDAEAGFL